MPRCSCVFPQRPGGRPSACEIAGILHVGENVARARAAGGRSITGPAPYSLTIEVVDAGELHVYQGGARLISIKAGQLHNLIAYSALEFLPISRILTCRRRCACGRASSRPRNEPAPRDVGLRMDRAPQHDPLHRQRRARARVMAARCCWSSPGARIIAADPQTNSRSDERASVLADRFVDFVNTRHVLADARVDRGRQPDDLMTQAQALLHLQNAAFAAEDDLVDVAEVVAGLDGGGRRACADRGSCARSGSARRSCSMRRSPCARTKPMGLTRQSPLGWPTVDSESFGMRHRSALRCVGVTDRIAAFVVSQDGQVSLFWKQDGRVFLKRNVNTANPNMIGSDDDGNDRIDGNDGNDGLDAPGSTTSWP